MTDSSTPAEPGPVDHDVELASAHLDGEVGPDERARAEDPAVLAHAAALGAVVDQVRDVPPPPAGLIDDHVARALQDFDADPRVVPLERRPAPSWWQRIPLGAVAAALVVVALVGAVALASRAGDDGSDDTATAALESADDDGGAASTGSGSGTVEDSGADATEESATFEADSAPGARTERQAYDSYEALADDLRAELAGSAPAGGGGGQAPAPASSDLDEGDGEAADTGDPCGAVERAGLDPATVVLVRSVLVAPDHVTAVVHDAEDGRRLVVVDDASCTVVLDRPL